MVRSLLVGILAVTAAASCKGGSDAPAVQPGVAAGKVSEVSGTVSATRGGERRALASGSEISGDDVIETGADGQIVIVLAHNNASWSLGPNKREQVAASLAWKAPKVDRPTSGTDEATSVAGRHAEKSGANTASTAEEEKVQVLQKNEKADVAVAATVPTPDGPPPPAGPTPRSEPSTDPAVASDSLGRDDTGPGSVGTSTGTSTAGSGASRGGDNKGAPRGGGGPGAALDVQLDGKALKPNKAPELERAIDTTEVDAMFTKELSAMKTCMVGVKTMSLDLQVRDHAVQFTLTGAGATDEMRVCFGTIAARTKLPKTGNIVIKHVITK